MEDKDNFNQIVDLIHESVVKEVSRKLVQHEILKREYKVLTGFNPQDFYMRLIKSSLDHALYDLTDNHENLLDGMQPCEAIEAVKGSLEDLLSDIMVKTNRELEERGIITRTPDEPTPEDVLEYDLENLICFDRFGDLDGIREHWSGNPEMTIDDVFGYIGLKEDWEKNDFLVYLNQTFQATLGLNKFIYTDDDVHRAFEIWQLAVNKLDGFLSAYNCYFDDTGWGYPNEFGISNYGAPKSIDFPANWKTLFLIYQKMEEIRESDKNYSYEQEQKRREYIEKRDKAIETYLAERKKKEQKNA